VFKWLTSFFLFLAVTAGIAASMPLREENSSMEMMDCCDKAKSNSDAPEASIARLCCAIHCSNSAPTAPGLSLSFSPSAVSISDSILKQIAGLLKREKTPDSAGLFLKERTIHPPKFPPKYLQHHSFLI
jgi:hypothetical protein